MIYSNNASGTCRAARTGLLARILARFDRMQTKRADRAMLKDLASRDDYLLADIGLTRFDFEQALASPHGEDVALVLMRARKNPLKDWRD